MAVVVVVVAAVLCCLAKGEEEALSVVVCFGLRVVEVEVDLICMLLVASCWTRHFSFLFSSSDNSTQHQQQ